MSWPKGPKAPDRLGRFFRESWNAPPRKFELRGTKRTKSGGWTKNVKSGDGSCHRDTVDTFTTG